jgi:arginine utilization protein RocB
LEDYNLITQENHHFLVMLPEIAQEKVNELMNRLQNLVTEQVGVRLIIGAASFPGDAVTFESLIEKARKDAHYKLKAASSAKTPSIIASKGSDT